MSDSAFDLKAGVPSVTGEMSPQPVPSKRYSKKLTASLMGLGIGIVSMLWYAMEKIDEEQLAAKAKAARAEGEVQVAAPKVLPKDLMGDQERGSASAPVDVPVGPVAALGGAPGGRAVGGTAPMGKGPDVPAVPALGSGQMPGGGQPGAETPEQREKRERELRLSQARLSGLGVKPWARGGGDKTAVSSAPSGYAQQPQMMPGQGQPVPPPTSEQDEKLAFLKEQGAAKPDTVHHYMVKPASGLLELKAGTFIPATLVTAVNSDLPGSVTAVVREAVYDSVREGTLLIPPGSKIFGRYDSKVAFGQQRLLVVWNQLMFPDGSELFLAGAPATDQSGQAGFDSDVDNHWFRLFGATFAMSMITAGVQLSLPQQSGSSTTGQPVSNSQVVSTALAQQFGQLGGQIAGKYLQVAPTLRNFPGERFNILLGRSVMFKSGWNGERWDR